MSLNAIVLAAGRGERMNPLSSVCPKPLLQIGGKALLQWSLENLCSSGQTQVLINTAWLGDQISEFFGLRFSMAPGRAAAGSSESAGVDIAYSHEGRDFGAALETAGGIVRALPRMSADFWVIAGDVFVPNFRFDFAAQARFQQSGALAHLWLVPNPAHNPAGDFGLAATPVADGEPVHLALSHADVQYTYSSIGLFRRELFAPPYCSIPPGNPQGVKAKLAPILRAAMDDGQVTAELYTGEWTDVGTPERLAELNAHWSAEEKKR